MKRYFLIFFILLLFRLKVYSLTEEEVEMNSRQALRFFAASDYQRASDIYERLLKQDLPDWQQALVLYNLGTIRLAQNQWTEALHFYHSIVLQHITNPALFKSLEFNQGVAYFQQAERIPLDPTSKQTDIEKVAYFLQQGLQHIQSAIKIECLVQQIEDRLSPCMNSSLLLALKQSTSNHFNQVRQLQREHLLAQATSDQILFLLVEALNRWKDSIFTINSSTSQLKSSYSLYLFSMGQTLIPLWNHVKEGGLNSKSQDRISQAQNLYVKALQKTEHAHFSTALPLLEESIKQLAAIQDSIEPSRAALEKSLFAARLLLFKTTIQKSDLQRLYHLEEQLSSSALKEKSLDSLSSSLFYFNPSEQSLTRFFLVHNLNNLQQIAQSSDHLPIKIIEQALEKAKNSLMLNRLFQFSQVKENKLNQKMQQILQESQKITLQSSQPFIPAVLDFEAKRFSQIGKIIGNRCQKRPWNQAISLFENGYESGQLAQTHLVNTPIHNQAAIVSQEQTILDWQQVLQLLNQNEEDSSSERQSQDQSQQTEQSLQSSSNIQDILQLIQEMEAEDAGQKPQGQPKDIQTW